MILQILSKIFLIPSLHIFVKKVFVKKYKKQMSYKEDTETAKPWGPEGPCPSTFGVAKRKKGNKGKKEIVSKQILSKGYRKDQNVTALAILERLEIQNFPCPPIMVADNIF